SSSRTSLNVVAEANSGVISTQANGFRGSPPSSQRYSSLRSRLASSVSDVTSSTDSPLLAKYVGTDLTDPIYLCVGIVLSSIMPLVDLPLHLSQLRTEQTAKSQTLSRYVLFRQPEDPTSEAA